MKIMTLDVAMGSIMIVEICNRANDLKHDRLGEDDESGLKQTWLLQSRHELERGETGANQKLLKRNRDIGHPESVFPWSRIVAQQIYHLQLHIIKCGS